MKKWTISFGVLLFVAISVFAQAVDLDVTTKEFQHWSTDKCANYVKAVIVNVAKVDENSPLVSSDIIDTVLAHMAVTLTHAEKGSGSWGVSASDILSGHAWTLIMDEWSAITGQ